MSGCATTTFINGCILTGSIICVLTVILALSALTASSFNRLWWFYKDEERSELCFINVHSYDAEAALGAPRPLIGFFFYF